MRANNLTGGLALKTPDNSNFILYQENTASIQLNLSSMAGEQPALAVNTMKDYAEINLGSLSATNQT